MHFPCVTFSYIFKKSHFLVSVSYCINFPFLFPCNLPSNSQFSASNSPNWVHCSSIWVKMWHKKAKKVPKRVHRKLSNSWVVHEIHYQSMMHKNFSGVSFRRFQFVFIFESPKTLMGYFCILKSFLCSFVILSKYQKCISNLETHFHPWRGNF